MIFSHRQRLAAFAALAVLTVASTVLYFILAGRVEPRSERDIAEETQLSCDLLTQWLSARSQSAELMARALEPLLTPANAQSLFPAMTGESVLGRHLVLYTAETGFVLPDEHTPFPQEIFPLWHKLATQVVDGPRFAGPVPSPRKDETDLLILHPLLSAHGGPRGVLILRIPIAELAAQAHRVAALAEKQRRVLLVTREQMLLTPESNQDVSAGPQSLTAMSDLAPLTELLQSPEGQSARVALPQGTFFAAHGTVAPSPWELVLLAPSGQELAVLPKLRAGLIGAWTFLGLVTVYLGVQSRKYDHYKALSEQDHLTGTGNRLAFEKAMSRLKRERTYPASLLIIDVDGLKILNDTLGHEEGDRLLQRLSRILRRSLREKDTVYRIGGDEFAILISKATSVTSQSLLSRILTNLAEARRNQGEPPLLLSYGLAEAANAQELATLYRRADEAMYALKNNNRQASAQQLRQWLVEQPGHV